MEDAAATFFLMNIDYIFLNFKDYCRMNVVFLLDLLEVMKAGIINIFCRTQDKRT